MKIICDSTDERPRNFKNRNSFVFNRSFIATHKLTSHLMRTSTNVQISVEIQSFRARHGNEQVSRALVVLVAVRVVGVIVAVNFEGIFVGQGLAVRFAACCVRITD